MTIEERMDHFEKELVATKRWNRWLLIAAGLVGGLFVLVWSFMNAAGSAQARENKKIEKVTATHFFLEDEYGKNHALMTVYEDGPSLVMFDKYDHPRLRMYVGKEGPALCLYDENDTPRVRLHLTNEGPALDMFDERGNARSEFSMNKSGPQVLLADENKQIFWATPPK